MLRELVTNLEHIWDISRIAEMGAKMKTVAECVMQFGFVSVL